MKKNNSVLFFVILLICLLSCAFILLLVLKKDNEDEMIIEYDDILFDINAELDNQFIYDKEIFKYISVNFQNNSNFVFAINDVTQDEYYIIIKNPSEEDLIELKSFVESYNERNDNDLKIKGNNMYKYLIKSNENLQVIDGIIRSYIYY